MTKMTEILARHHISSVLTQDHDRVCLQDHPALYNAAGRLHYKQGRPEAIITKNI